MRFVILLSALFLALSAQASRPSYDYSACRWWVLVEADQGADLDEVLNFLNEHAENINVDSSGSLGTLIGAEYRFEDGESKSEARKNSYRAIRKLEAMPGVTADCMGRRKVKPRLTNGN